MLRTIGLYQKLRVVGKPSKVLYIFSDIKCKQNLKIRYLTSTERKINLICQYSRTLQYFLQKVSIGAGPDTIEYLLLQYFQSFKDRSLASFALATRRAGY